VSPLWGLVAFCNELVSIIISSLRDSKQLLKMVLLPVSACRMSKLPSGVQGEIIPTIISSPRDSWGKKKQ